MRTICTLLATTTVALAAVTAASSTVPPKLLGTVGPGFTISLKQNGKPVRTLKPGRYMFVVSDKASIHDFHLSGPGLSRVITGVGFTGTKTATVTLKRGTYSYKCDVHPTTMRATFRVV